MRRNLSQDFEGIYLRFNTVQRFLKYSDHSILTQAEYQKIIKFMAAKYFYGNRRMLSINGFEYDDIMNIVSLFTVTFFGLVAANKSHYNNTLLMRFISQRMHNFINWVTKKFHVNDVNLVYADNYEYLSSSLSNPNTIIVDGVTMWGTQHSPAITDALKNWYNQLDYVDQQLKHNKDFALKHQRKYLLKQIERLHQQLQQYSQQKMVFKQLRDKLHANPQQYSEQLSYYATIKHVSADVRKVARLICKKYCIDYKEWAKKKIEQNSVYINELTF